MRSLLSLLLLLLQWEEACQVAAARFVPSLVILAAALFGAALPGTGLPLLPPGIVAAVLVAVVTPITPVPHEVSSCLMVPESHERMGIVVAQTARQEVAAYVLLVTPEAFSASMLLQVTEYAQRFNLSASLVASITRVSAWLSSAILLALLVVVGQSMTQLNTAQDMVSVTSVLSAVRWPMFAVAVTAAAMLVISVPLSARLAIKSRSQQPQMPAASVTSAAASGPEQAPAEDRTPQPSATPAEQSHGPGGNAQDGIPTTVSETVLSTSDGQQDVPPHAEGVTSGPVEGPEEEPSEDKISELSTLPARQPSVSGETANMANVGTPGIGLDSNVQEAADSRPGGQSSAGSSKTGPVAGPDQEPSEDTISEPSTLPADPSSETGSSAQVGTPGLGLDSNIQDAPDEQQGAERSERGSGFFRDIGADCLPRSRHRHVLVHPGLRQIGVVRRVRHTRSLRWHVHACQARRHCPVNCAFI